jgi:nitrate/TMAO reductase-like tetraheme cytochrome c subunit
MAFNRNRGFLTWVVGCTVSALLVTSAALAFQNEQKKDADLPPEVAKLPFEIRDGYRKFTKRCTACHDRKRVDDAKKSLFDWQGTIGTMAFKKGADIPLEERHGIFLYLTYVHGTKGTPEEKEQYMAFLTKCEDCHGVSLMYKEKYSMKKWPAIIHRMAGKNQAMISEEDEKKVMGYISRMHPDLFGIDD